VVVTGAAFIKFNGQALTIYTDYMIRRSVLPPFIIYDITKGPREKKRKGLVEKVT
jgi:hypothetical protein